MKYSAFIISNNDSLAQDCLECFSGANVEIFDGRGYPSFAKLINDCILKSKEEVVIIINQKIRGNITHIARILYLLHSGFGLVTIQNFHMFGFKKDLIRKIGWFDERFLGGGSEDSDFVRRVIEADIAWFDAQEVPVIKMPSSWNGSVGAEMLNKKWRDGKMERIFPDESYDYNIGPYKGTKFWPKSKSVLSMPNETYYNSIGFKFN